MFLSYYAHIAISIQTLLQLHLWSPTRTNNNLEHILIKHSFIHSPTFSSALPSNNNLPIVQIPCFLFSHRLLIHIWAKGDPLFYSVNTDVVSSHLVSCFLNRDNVWSFWTPSICSSSFLNCRPCYLHEEFKIGNRSYLAKIEESLDTPSWETIKLNLFF